MRTPPLFPHFEHLTQDHEAFVSQMTSHHLCYSDFNFTSLYCWNLDNKTVVSRLNDNLIIRIKAYESDQHLYSFMGKNKLIETAYELLEKYGELNLVPEFIGDSLRKDKRFEVSEDIKSNDYILDLQDLVAYPGRPYKDKRYGNRKGRELYKKVLLEPVSITSKVFKTNVFQLLETWVQQKESKYDTAEFTSLNMPNLIEAIDRIFDLTSTDILCLQLLLDDQFAGFIFAEDARHGYILSHFINGDTRFKFVYEIFYNEIGRYFSKNGYSFLNLEQDIDITYLRKSKLKWHPSHFLKKYVIRLTQ